MARCTPRGRLSAQCAPDRVSRETSAETGRERSEGLRRAAYSDDIGIAVGIGIGIASRAIRQELPDADLSQFSPGYIIYTEAAAGSPSPHILVEWIGRDAIAVERGESPELDRKQVRKLQVKMGRDGQVEEVLDTSTWLYRRLEE